MISGPSVFKELVFSGIQPTGHLHLGHYLGTLRNFVALQETFQCIYCVVDAHALTSFQAPLELSLRSREVAACFIASGVDPSRSLIFKQSQVVEHTELAWILGCIARIGWLNRMTQFKDKAGKHRENASVGLFTYPILMAADILAYRATHSAVGEDQKQHLELTRDIAQKFNTDFEESISACGFGPTYFPLVEPVVPASTGRIMSLRDGLKKMSSSASSDHSRLNLTDNADVIALKLRRARTDSDPLPDHFEELEARPEAKNLVVIYAALGGLTPQDVLHEYQGCGFSLFKQALIDLTVAKLTPIGREVKALLSDPSHVDTILRDGAERARLIAGPVLKSVKEIVGFTLR
ncbi:MAG: tryptophan--tRNA ligase [Alphaproteobacteria bacterium]|nr:tryptophan--tRNA ligase [Alphaproteobacteria bacterium]